VRWLLAALLLLGAATCRKQPRRAVAARDAGRAAALLAPPRVVLDQGVVWTPQGDRPLFADGVRTETIDGYLGLPGGDGIVVKRMGALSVVRGDPPYPVGDAWMSAVEGELLATSADGHTVLVQHHGSQSGRQEVRALGGLGGRLEFRAVMGVDLSPDGTMAVVAGFGTDCVGSLNPCSIEVWGMGARAAPLVSTRGARAYQPLFVPGGLVSVQTTERDGSAECLEDLNRCRHDLALLDPSGTAPPRFLREGALRLNVSGARAAFLQPEGCPTVNCQKHSLYVANLGNDGLTDVRRLVREDVALFGGRSLSPDGNWVAYWSSETARRLHLISVDGKQHFDHKNARIIGWLR